jgi:ubiquinone/menaquinone biosynthesis C-methylase UbiE
MSTATVGHYLLGTEGLALLRTWLFASPETLARRVAEVSHLAGNTDTPPMSLEFTADDLEVVEGYARWSQTYDTAPNPLIRAEEPVVRAMIDRVAPGIALDAGCGTARHTAYLVERHRSVIGVDASPAMLARARARVPSADFRVGDLARLPVEDASIDIAVCALALTHVADLSSAIGELARAVRPRGTVILSDLHPTMVLLGGTGLFFGSDGRAGKVRSFHHPQSSYLAAFRGSGLNVVDCAEPVIDEADLAALSGGLSHVVEEAFRAAWVGIPNALVWQLVRRE